MQSLKSLPRLAAALAALFVMLMLSAVITPLRASAAPYCGTGTFPLFSATPVLPIPAGTFTCKAADLNWDGVTPVFLSGYPDTTGDIFYYNQIQIWVNGKLMTTQNAKYGCDAYTPPNPPPMSRPINLVDFIYQGPNHIEVIINDECGYVGNSDIFLATGRPALPAPSPLPAPPPPVSSTCGTKFFGVRGSGEKSVDVLGFGFTVGMMYYGLNHKGVIASKEAIDYPAIPVNPASYTYTRDYVNSVAAGISILERSLRDFVMKCPRSYAIVAGYSQGAEVVDRTYAQLSSTMRRHIASVTVFGDPGFNPKQPAVDKGDFSPKLSGINIKALGDKPLFVPIGWESRNQSYCTAGDPICNFHLKFLAACNKWTSVATCPHAQYSERGFTDWAAAWAVNKLRSLPHL